MGTIPYGYKNQKQSRSIEEQLKKEGVVRAIGHVTFLDGTRSSYEIVAKQNEKYLYVYRNFKKVYIVRVDGVEFKEILIADEQSSAPSTGPTWKFVGGKAVKS